MGQDGRKRNIITLAGHEKKKIEIEKEILGDVKKVFIYLFIFILYIFNLFILRGNIYH